MTKLSSFIPFLLLPSILGSVASAQVLFVNSGGTESNPSLATGAISRSGSNAPAGTLWSEVPVEFGAANVVAGFASHRVDQDSTYRISDDFTVPSGDGWTLNGLRFFAYEPEISSIFSPVASANVRIWNGRPGDLGSTVVWGDTTTALSTTSTPMNVLRIFSSNTAPAATPPDDARPIWQVDVPVTIQLDPGTYWIDWQFVARDASFSVFAPTSTISGRRAPANANALRSEVGVWSSAIDIGRPASALDVVQEFAFVLLGGPTCPADVDLSGGVDGDDVIIFFGWWDANDTRADLTDDGGVDGDDLIEFFARWDSGC